MTPRCSDTLPILGIPVRFEASDPPLLSATLAGYAHWRGVSLSPPDASGVRVRIGWHGPDFSRPDVLVEPAIVVTGSRIRVCAPGLEGSADHGTGEASCRVAGWLAADPQRLATDLLDTLLLFMLTRRNRVPLHAAGIVRNGVAALLCAPSGVGKSTLALAAAGAGWKLLSDDAVYLESLNGEGVRVWGWPRAVYLARTTTAGEGEGELPLRLRNGRVKEALALPGAWAEPPVAEAGVLIALERGSGPAAARRIEPAAAVAEVLDRLDGGFDVFGSSLEEALRHAASGGTWRVTLPADPEEALAVLSDTIDLFAALRLATADE